MTAIRELLTQIPDPNLSLNERVKLRCQLAKQLEKTGNYEAARAALEDLWPDFGDGDLKALGILRLAMVELLMNRLKTSFDILNTGTDEAHEHLDRAQAIFTRLGDAPHLASIDDSRARVWLAEGATAKAEHCASTAIATFEKGDNFSKLAEALTTHGVALARLNRHEEARSDFERAMSTAEQIEDLQNAGLAALSFIEELADLMSEDELCFVMERARTFLQDTQDPLVLNRLSKCACRVLSIIHAARPDWNSFSLTETLRRHEGRFIQMALEDAGGSVTKAAGLLGLPGHQSLNFILQNRHPERMNARTPIKPRRRRMFKLINPQKDESNE